MMSYIIIIIIIIIFEKLLKLPPIFSALNIKQS